MYGQEIYIAVSLPGSYCTDSAQGGSTRVPCILACFLYNRGKCPCVVRFFMLIVNTCKEFNIVFCFSILTYIHCHTAVVLHKTTFGPHFRVDMVLDINRIEGNEKR